MQQRPTQIERLPQGERNSVSIHLMDGRVVDVCTESGANAFLQAGSESKEYLSGNVEQMSEICAKRRLNAKDKSDLLMMSLFFESISRYGSRDVFRQHVEQSTIKAWLDHVIQQIRRLSTNRNWITTGKLPIHDTKLLESCISMMCHAVPVVFAFDSEFFNVLADFVKARKGTGRALPCADICDTITLIVSNAHNTSRGAFDNAWTTEKALKKLEATGVLEQFIRCATVPQSHDFSAPGLFGMLDEFQACVPFISKRLQPGQPCGDVVMAILEDRDGSRVQRPSIINKLRTMIRFASSVDPEHKCEKENRLCRHCGKADYSDAFQKSLMKCSRCQQAYYCSKECQKADWKTHKKICTPRTKKAMVMSENVQQMLSRFFYRQYVDIMVKVIKTCDETGLSKKDMLVELNFKANEYGIVPAMQAEPEFKIAPVKDYIEGSRPAEPDWFGKKYNRRMYENNVNEYLAIVKEKYNKVQPNQILSLVVYEGGFSCYQVGLVEPTTHKEMFSEEAVLAFKAYMEDDDVGPLSAMFSPEFLRPFRRDLFKMGYGLPDERETMDALRMYEELYGHPLEIQMPTDHL